MFSNKFQLNAEKGANGDILGMIYGSVRTAMAGTPTMPVTIIGYSRWVPTHQDVPAIPASWAMLPMSQAGSSWVNGSPVPRVERRQLFEYARGDRLAGDDVGTIRHLRSRFAGIVAGVGDDGSSRIRCMGRFFSTLRYALRTFGITERPRVLELGYGKSFEILDRAVAMGARAVGVESEGKRRRELQARSRLDIQRGMLRVMSPAEFEGYLSGDPKRFQLAFLNSPHPYDGVPRVLQRVVEDAVIPGGLLTVASEEYDSCIKPYVESPLWRTIFVGNAHRRPLFSSEFFYYHSIYGTRVAVFRRR